MIIKMHHITPNGYNRNVLYMLKGKQRLSKKSKKINPLTISLQRSLTDFSPLPLPPDDLDIDARRIPRHRLLRRTEMIALIPNPIYSYWSSYLSSLWNLEDTLARSATTPLLRNKSILKLGAPPGIKVTRIHKELSWSATALPIGGPLLDVSRSVLRFCLAGDVPVDCAQSAGRSIGFRDVSVFLVGALD